MRMHHASIGGALSALIFFLVLTASTSAADTTNCLPDCPADSFGVSTKTVLELPGGCFVRVTWAKRVACNQFYDVSIQSIEPLTAECGGRPISILMSDATKALLQKNPMAFPPLPPVSGVTCATNWRVVKGACWKYSVECNDTIAKPCDLTECCLTPYEVCVDSSGKRTVTPLGGGSEATCDSASGCVPVCGGGGGMFNPGDDPELSSTHDATRHDREALLTRKVRIAR